MKKPPLTLRLRIFLALMSVVGFAGLATFLVGWTVAPRYFEAHLIGLREQPSIQLLREEEAELQAGFNFAWLLSSVWALGLSLPLALGLSMFVSRRIVGPLTEIQRGTEEFAKGDFARRMGTVGIPELDRVVRSFNTMADSLQEVEQHRQRLIADLAHELRTPLTVIAGYLEGLEDGDIAPDPVVYQRLHRETQRLRRLVRDLQELSKAEAGYLTLDLRPCALKPLVQEILAKFQLQVPEEGPALVLAIGELPPVLADPERVEQILINLLSNALRHTATGKITLGATLQGDWVTVRVEDTGTGIAPDDLPHIFERFWRSDQSRARETGGSGIGLTIVKKLIEIQGGTIHVTSTLGQGTIFLFTLPVA